jgi:hypothetical protein
MSRLTEAVLLQVESICLPCRTLPSLCLQRWCMQSCHCNMKMLFQAGAELLVILTLSFHTLALPTNFTTGKSDG